VGGNQLQSLIDWRWPWREEHAIPIVTLSLWPSCTSLIWQSHKPGAKRCKRACANFFAQFLTRLTYWDGGST
jgi:hypothetical protein